MAGLCCLDLVSKFCINRRIVKICLADFVSSGKQPDKKFVPSVKTTATYTGKMTSNTTRRARDRASETQGDEEIGSLLHAA